ncbi:MAG TPA: hypothetical protein VMH28_29225 [Candidatus Acidoferrales bacterium]|nr:hypothetical protein [Candidatus Acidoferrales bacterium]
MILSIRAITAAACCGLSLCAADDPKEIVARALQRNAHNEEIARNYTYLRRQETRAYDGSGSVKHRDSKTWDVTLLEGSPYTRLVQRDDKPLPPKEEAQQQEALQKSIEERRKETPEQRQQRIAEWDRKRKAFEDELKEIPEAFILRLVGEEQAAGVPAWVIEGTPRPGYRPKTKRTAYFLKMKGRMWISKSDYQPVKVEAESIDTIAIGAFLVRFQRGARIRVEYTRVNDEVWLPKSAALAGSARVLLVKGLRIDTDFTFSNYRKFVTESRVVSTER